MNLSNLLKSTNLNNKNLKNTANIKGINSLTKASKNAAISSFLDGDIVKGEVVDIKGLLAKILTNDGEEIKGHLQSIGQLNIGDEREFLVKNENGVTKFSILPEDEKNMLENNLKKQLMLQGLKATDEDVETAKELIKNELPVNKETFINVSRALTLLSKDGKSLDKALFLLKNEVPINSKNTNMLDNFVNKNINMLKNSNDIEKSINAIKNTTLKQALIKIFNDTSDDTKSKINNGEANKTSDNIENENSNSGITSNETNKSKNISNLLGDLDDIVGNEKEVENDNAQFKEISKDALKFSIKTGYKSEIDDFLNETSKKLDQAIKLLESNRNELDSGSQKLLEILTTQKQSVDFMQFAKENVYLQLPLKINDNEANCELLVFKDKKRKKGAKDGVSAIIGLDTANLGRYETYIHKIGNDINLQFRLKNDDVIKITKENLYKLDGLLKQHNLNIASVTYKTVENSFTLITKESYVNDTIDVPDSFMSYNFNVKL